MLLAGVPLEVRMPLCIGTSLATARNIARAFGIASRTLTRNDDIAGALGSLDEEVRRMTRLVADLQHHARIVARQPLQIVRRRIWRWPTSRPSGIWTG